ncbi:MAG: hypothetical protein H6711_25975 [Myxococcales bacterium]|nr:hypothetical protein [Myxococcales bacterium]
MRRLLGALVILVGCGSGGDASSESASDTVGPASGTSAGSASASATSSTGSGSGTTMGSDSGPTGSAGTSGSGTSAPTTGGTGTSSEGTTGTGTGTGTGTDTDTDTDTTGTPLGDVGSGATVVYVGKVTDVTDLSPTGLDLGKHGYYFPQFGQGSSKSKRKARDNMRFLKPTWQRDWEWKVFELCGGEFCNLFSPDAGVFDVLEGEEGIGVYSESGGGAWAAIQTAGGSGNSGSVVDEAAHDNSNNSVNHIRMNADVPAEFCMSILTDNTAGKHDISGGLAARIGWYGDVDLEAGTASVPDEDLVFNGVPDLYVFRYANMTEDDFIKIRLNGKGTDPGFGGLMFDPCE